MIKTVLFDLDGTLLPMDQEKFVRCYLNLLAEKMAPLGYDSKKLIKCVWVGTEKMAMNDGSCKNDQVFWDIFAQFFGKDSLKDIPEFENFYRNEFQKAAESCGFSMYSAEIIRKLHAMGLQTVLATNPLFPAIATESRIRWAGLLPEDFALITTFENSSYCKPNPAYYQDIMAKLNLIPEECIMVGNDVQEDMVAAELGMKVFLLTDCLIDRKQTDISQFPHGSFPELLNYLSRLQNFS